MITWGTEEDADFLQGPGSLEAKGGSRSVSKYQVLSSTYYSKKLLLVGRNKGAAERERGASLVAQW